VGSGMLKMGKDPLILPAVCVLASKKRGKEVKKTFPYHLSPFGRDSLEILTSSWPGIYKDSLF